MTVFIGFQLNIYIFILVHICVCLFS